MAEAKTIYCPVCKRKAFDYDGRGSINIRIKCKKCKKIVLYAPDTDSVKMCDVPTRNCSSGRAIY